MARPRSHREMETLSTTLGRRSKTTGRVTPVPRPKNPYVSQTTRGRTSRPTQAVAPGGINANLATALGVAAQNKPKAPVSTQIQTINYESDPVLARIKALGSQTVANAQTEAQALKKKAIIESGAADVGQELGLDASTLQAARDNPFSTAAEIRRSALERGRELDESLNQENLFYSGFRGNQLGELERSRLQAEAEMSGGLRNLLGQIDTGVLDARNSAAEQEAQALQTAALAAQDAAYQQSLIDALNPPVVEPTLEEALAGAGTMAPAVAPSSSLSGLGGAIANMGNLAVASAPYVTPAYSAPAFAAPLTLEEELALATGGGGGGGRMWVM